MQPSSSYHEKAIESEEEGEDETEEDSGVALDSTQTAGEHITDPHHSMHHGDHVHTLEETIDAEQPLLFHLHAGGGREHEQHGHGRDRGRSISNGTAGSRPIRSLSGRARCTSTGEHGSRVREVIRDGEIVPIAEEGHARGEDSFNALHDEESEWAQVAGTGHRLAEPTRLQTIQRNLKRVYDAWSGVFSLISVCLSSVFATILWSSLSPLALSWLAGQSGLSLSPSYTSQAYDAHTTSTVSSLGQTVELDGLHYFVPGKAKHTLALTESCQTAFCRQHVSDLFPLTVVESDARTFGSENLRGVLANYASRDDVWNTAFAKNILLHNNATRSLAALEHTFVNEQAGNIFLNGYSASGSSSAIPLRRQFDLPAGPYFAAIKCGNLVLHEAWRLHSDTARAFFYGTVPHHKDDSAFSVLSASLPNANGLAALGVPSRLYYKKTAKKPLAGVRVSVKDLYDLKGTKTSMGNRAWLELYPAASSTAPSVQRFIDLGAIIVGKTRLSQFAKGQYGTADNVDYGVPFNVRGDGYQDPSSSSSGSGSSAAAYAFIDLALGSDTGGSVRAPAGVNGVYGNRPSQGAIDLSGALPLSPSMDTAAVLAYDAKNFATYAKAYYGGNATFRSYPAFPKKLRYIVNPQTPLSTDDTVSPQPGFFPSNNEAARPIYEEFVQKLESLLEVQRETVDFYALFKSYFGMYPAEYVGPAWSHLTAHDQWKLVGQKFEADYKAANNGDRPFVDPPVRQQWNYAATLTDADSIEYLERKAAVASFISEHLLTRDNIQSCSNALTIFPLSDGTPSYKSDYHLASQIFNGFNKYSISQLGQVPEVVIPIGEVPYLSKITQTTKYLPVSISIQAAAGCDFVLYDLITALADAGIIRSTVPGTARTF